MPSERETILVTGAAGFIGSHLVDRLLADGATVVGVDNFDPFYARADKEDNLRVANSHPRFRFHELDCTDVDAMDRQLAREPTSAVVHLAAKAGVRPSIDDPVGYMRANVLGTQAVLEFTRRRGIRRMVFGSSSSVYGDAKAFPLVEEFDTGSPVSPYAASKRAGELLCSAHHHLHDTSIIALRFFTVYGPRQRPDLAIRKFGTLMLQGSEIPVFGDGTSERDYTWIDDIIDGVVASIARTRFVPRGFDIINLGGSRMTALARLVALLASALHIEPRLARSPMQPGDVLRTCADVSKARRLLGYVARTPIERGIPRFAEWLAARVQQRAPSVPTRPALVAVQ